MSQALKLERERMDAEPLYRAKIEAEWKEFEDKINDTEYWSDDLEQVTQAIN